MTGRTKSTSRRTLMVAAAVGLLLALDWGGTHYRWMSWQIWALIGGSAVLWVLLRCDC